MSMNELQKQTNANIQAKANLIWEIATHLVGLFKPHEYGKVILPMTVLKRFDDALVPTKTAVVEMAKKLDTQHVEGAARDGILCRVSGFDFYNTSNYDFAKLISDPDNVETNFEAYLRGFSSNVKDIIENFDFANTVKLMVKGGVLFVTLQEFNSAKADMSPEKITSADMGYIFEELIRKFSESYDEQAGAHFTSRDIIYLMAELLVAPEKAKITAEGCTKTAYDMAMGTSQMLGCLTERLQAISEDADLTCFGQEFNPETYAIAKADMLIKGGNASGMKYGDTLSDDAFSGYEFDYIISNPPFGIDWKREKTQVESEAMHLTSLWFFYASLVSLYTGSFESTVEKHLNTIKGLKTLSEYKEFILSRINERLTNDFFDITLVGSEGLAVSGRGNNAWNAYVASLNIMNAKILFSKSNLFVSKLFEPGTDGNRKSLEKHHLFPKAYLKSLNCTDAKINQMANYALIDWKDNMDILDDAPSVYYPIICAGMSDEQIRVMEEENALPHGWENMSYDDFLIERRKLMAAKIKIAFEVLKKAVTE